jgi:hypothetical protein
MGVLNLLIKRDCRLAAVTHAAAAYAQSRLKLGKTSKLPPASEPGITREDTFEMHCRGTDPGVG